MLPGNTLIRSAVALCLAILLSRCVIVPVRGPYHHPHHDYGY